MRAILIDDEQLALDYLESQLNKISDISIIHKFVSFDLDRGTKLLEEIDIIFLDIEMPGMNGIQLAGKLLEIKPSLIIVFVTAFPGYAVQAFELNSLDYIVKPVQLDRLEKTIERIEKEIKFNYKETISKGRELQINVCRELSFGLPKDEPIIIQWRTTKAKELFLYLLLHAEKTVRKSELAFLLWPEVNFNNDYAQLYTAIYHVRQTLNKFSNYFALKNVGDGYHLSTHNVSIDIVKWERFFQSAPPINKKTIVDYETMMKLYAGNYLQEYDYLWAEPERYRLEILWLKTAHQLADFYFQHKDLENAETWYVKICELRPEDENAHFSLMKIYGELGYGLLVDHQFIQLKNALNEFNIPVSSHVKKWYNQWSNHLKL